MSHSFTWENNGLYWKYYGVLEVEDLIYANSELIGNQKIEYIKYIIWDATNIDIVKLDEMAVQISTTFSATVDSLNSHIKVAFLAEDKLLRDLVENYIELNLKQIPHAQLKLFTHIDDARSWISS